jgi:hypothetical protein
LNGLHYDRVLTDPKYNSKGNYVILDVAPGTRLTSPIDGVISSYTYQAPELFGTGTISYIVKSSSGELVQIFVPPGTLALVDMGS